MNTDLKNKVILIADAATPVGKAAAELLLAAGAKPVCCVPAAKAAADAGTESVDSAYGTVPADSVSNTDNASSTSDLIPVDFTSEEDLRALVDRILADERYGRLEGLFYNMIPDVIRKRVSDLSVEDVDGMIDRDITAAFAAAKVIGCHLMTLEESTPMVFLGSIHDEKPTGIAPLFSMYMGALRNLIREGGIFFGSGSVRLNLIEAGALGGEDELFRNDISTFYDGYEYKIPDGHVGTPEEIAKIALFLLSDESRYVHGEAIRADGGLVLHYIDAIANIYGHRRTDDTKKDAAE